MPERGDLDARLMLHGLPWHERLAASRGQQSSGMALDSDPIRDWQTLIERTGSGAFAKRLEWQGLGSDGAQHLVELHPLTGEIPDWLVDLHTLMETMQDSVTSLGDDWFAAMDARVSEVMRPEVRPIPYAHLLMPLVDRSLQRVRSQAVGSGIPESAFSPSAWNDLAVTLLSRLSGLLNVSLQEFRASASYAEFCLTLASDGLASALWEFPVAGRPITVLCHQWEANALALIERVTNDRGLLSETFGIPLDARVTQVTWDLSDPHRGGASVAILSFEGDAPRLVYKPKDVRLEETYSVFVRRLMSEFGVPDNHLRVQAVGRDYGYASFVAHEPCEREALPDFYRQAGRLAAALHILGASDCHHENLIACGTDLILIDAETLFEVEAQVQLPQVVEQVPDAIDGCVLWLGMLPAPSVRVAGAAPEDVSALGIASASGRDDQWVRGWLETNTDAMVLGKRTIQNSQPPSLPVPAGTPNPVSDHADDLVAGFAEVYRWAMVPENGERIASELADFEGLRKRVVLRNTSVYGILQHRASTPRALRSALVRGFELDRLSRSSLVHAEPTALWDVFRTELEAMERWDVPYFDFDLGATTLFESVTPIQGMMNENGIDRARNDLKAMCEKDLAWQVSLIRASLSLCDSGEGAGSSDVRSPVQAQDIVTAVRDLALEDRLGDPTWLTIDYQSGSGGRQLQLTAQDLYGGQAGAVATLFAGAHASGEPDDEQFAERALQPILRMLSDDGLRFRLQRDRGLGVGGYGGVLRLMEMLTHEGWAPRLGLTLPDAVAGIDPGVVAGDGFLDVVSGVAGALPVVARLSANGELGTGLTVLMARRLLEEQDASGGWILRKSPGLSTNQPLTGLAHGASGMGLALLEAGVALGDESMVAAGARAFAYEDSVFDEAVGNWPDFRIGDEDAGFMSGWCGGAPGIGLARMRALELLPDHPDAPLWQAALERSAASTMATGVGVRDHVCCGNMGRAGVLGLMGQASGRPDWVAAGDEIAQQVHARALEERGYALGPKGQDRAGYDTPFLLPAFMQGLSGIAFTSLVGTTSRALRALLV